MANKVLSFIRNFHKPVEKFLIVKGWDYRLYKKKKRGFKFKKLSIKQKKEVKNYWKKYNKRVNPDWAAYFSYGNDNFDPKYIPESLYYGEISQKLSVEGMDFLEDKNLQEQIFDSKQPEIIIRKINNFLSDKKHQTISYDEAIELCKNQKEVVIKPTVGTYGGEGIVFWKPKDGIEKLENILSSFEQLIIQEVIEPHEFMQSITKSSINTLRVVTLIVKGEPVLLSTLLRMSKEGSRIDGVLGGGIIGVVDQNGFLKKSAVQLDQSIKYKHENGFVFQDKKIPSYSRMINDAFKQHKKIPYFKMVSWDYAIDKYSDPVLIEANVPTGQIDFHQINIGPIFGKYTDQVLNHVYKNEEL